MKFNAPLGATSISVGGECFNVENGQIETPDHGEYANLLAPHGFTVVVPEAVAAPEVSQPEATAEAPAEQPEAPAEKAPKRRSKKAE